MIDALDAESETRRPIRGARRGRRKGPVTLAELEHGRSLAAFAVLHHGERYLAIFERLDEACGVMQRREESLSRVHRFAAAGEAGAR
ncbi:MAG TPA: hypothetical protein VNX29_01990 [Kaistia sp.]|nr:hypothetical protein [Kaistia sp.]